MVTMRLSNNQLFILALAATILAVACVIAGKGTELLALFSDNAGCALFVMLLVALAFIQQRKRR